MERETFTEHLLHSAAQSRNDKSNLSEFIARYWEPSKLDRGKDKHNRMCELLKWNGSTSAWVEKKENELFTRSQCLVVSIDF